MAYFVKLYYSMEANAPPSQFDEIALNGEAIAGSP